MIFGCKILLMNYLAGRQGKKTGALNLITLTPMQKSNTTYVLIHFMARLGIPFRRQSVSDELEKYHDYYSRLIAHRARHYN